MLNVLKYYIGRAGRWALPCILVVLCTGIQATGQQYEKDCRESIALLRDAVSAGETFFIKVHAAENLIGHDQLEGLDTTFANLQALASEYLIGSARVLARLYRKTGGDDQPYIEQLVQEFKQAGTRQSSLTALESLAKLGYARALPEIKVSADTGTAGFKAMARWVLANNRKSSLENRLSELLVSKDLYDYRYAAYAIRFRNRVNRLTVERLKQCLNRIGSNDIARVYVASALFVHSSGKGKEEIKPVLLSYLQGDAGQRYEVAEALSRAGRVSDVPTLHKLLTDGNRDVRVAAANALLSIMRCKK